MNRRTTNLDGLKGKPDVTSGSENANRIFAAPFGRRKFLALGGAGVAALASSATAAALIRAGGSNPTPRSPIPLGVDPATGRERTGKGAPSGGVRHLELVGTDGWVSMPSSVNTFVGPSRGAAVIDPFFPDPLAESNKTTFAFCFRNVTGLDQAQVAAQKGHTQTCAPLFYSTVGEEIWVTLTNLGLALRPDLVDSHTIHWHGFRNAIPFYDGVPESSISVPIGRDFTYVYRPEDAGTYMYHCHFEDVEHVTMGMHGIVFVKPNPNDRVGLTDGQQKAYGVTDGDHAGETRYDREYAIMLSEVDSRAHFNDAHIQTTDWTDFHADFWTMNGRAYPDTLQPNGVRDETGQLFAQRDGGIDTNGKAQLTKINDFTSDESRLYSQPLSSLVQCAPGERILIRFSNLGFLDHSFSFPGLDVDVLGRDARYVQPSAQRTATDAIQIGPGESRDVFFTAPAQGTYPFFDRGLSHYTGSADGTNEWVGGQRSEVRVIAGLAPQLKPNGWAGEDLWHGEFPLAAAHGAPMVTAAGTRSNSPGNRGTFIDGTVIVDANVPGTFLSNLWWVKAPGAPANTAVVWISAPFNAGIPNTFNIRVGNGSNGTTGTYWVLARDSAGVYSAPFMVKI